MIDVPARFDFGLVALSVVSLVLLVAVVVQRERAGRLTLLQLAIALVAFAWFVYTILEAVAS